MATDECVPTAPSEKLQANIAKIEQLSQRLVAALSRKQGHDPALDAPDPGIFLRAGTAWMQEAAKNPA